MPRFNYKLSSNSAMRFWCEGMVKMDASKAEIVGCTNLPGNSRESLKIPGKFPFPGKPKIRENRHH